MKAKYFLYNEDSVIAIVYENEKYGRTMVITGRINPNSDIKLYDRESSKTINEVDFKEYLCSLLPED